MAFFTLCPASLEYFAIVFSLYPQKEKSYACAGSKGDRQKEGEWTVLVIRNNGFVCTVCLIARREQILNFILPEDGGGSHHVAKFFVFRKFPVR